MAVDQWYDETKEWAVCYFENRQDAQAHVAELNRLSSDYNRRLYAIKLKRDAAVNILQTKLIKEGKSWTSLLDLYKHPDILPWEEKIAEVAASYPTKDPKFCASGAPSYKVFEVRRHG